MSTIQHHGIPTVELTKHTPPKKRERKNNRVKKESRHAKRARYNNKKACYVKQVEPLLSSLLKKNVASMIN